MLQNSIGIRLKAATLLVSAIEKYLLQKAVEEQKSIPQLKRSPQEQAITDMEGEAMAKTAQSKKPYEKLPLVGIGNSEVGAHFTISHAPMEHPAVGISARSEASE